MKVFVTKSSKLQSEGEIREYKDLTECIETLLSKEDFGKFVPEVIISRPDDIYPCIWKSCDYIAEIYDTWRE